MAGSKADCYRTSTWEVDDMLLICAADSQALSSIQMSWMKWRNVSGGHRRYGKHEPYCGLFLSRFLHSYLWKKGAKRLRTRLAWPA